VGDFIQAVSIHFLEALQSAAYNARPFPAGQLLRRRELSELSMPYVTEQSANAVAFLLSVDPARGAATQAST